MNSSNVSFGVHEYNDIDHKIVHAAIALALEQYTRYAADVQSFLDRR